MPPSPISWSKLIGMPLSPGELSRSDGEKLSLPQSPTQSADLLLVVRALSKPSNFEMYAARPSRDSRSICSFTDLTMRKCSFYGSFTAPATWNVFSPSQLRPAYCAFAT